MSLFSSILNILPDSTKAMDRLRVDIPQARLVGFNGVTLYPANAGTKYISEGFNRNWMVYSIVQKCAKKAAQIPVYHYKIKRNERKTWEEYRVLTKNGLSPENILEAKKMRIKSVDQTIVDSDLSELLHKSNRNQSGAMFIENLCGYRLLTGEGNIIFNRQKNMVNGELVANGKPMEMLIIPKAHLSINGDGTPWGINSYNVDLNGTTIRNVVPENVIMWVTANYNFNPVTLEHLRGFSPLEAGLLMLQASNEGAKRMVNMNNNQGAAGLLYRKDARTEPTGPQAAQMRQQVNDTVNSSDMAGAIAMMAGEWGYLQFGLDAEQLKLLEQTAANMEALCNIYDVPPGLFAKDQTYENLREAKRNFIYDNIAPTVYSLRDLLNEKLIPSFGLDRERDVIDWDVLSLPELAADIQKQVDALSKADWITQNEKRVAMNYEEIPGEAWNAAYMASGKQTVEQTFEGISGDLTEDVNELGDDD